MSEAKKSEAVINSSLTYTLGEGKQLVFATHFEKDEDIDKALDRLVHAGDRQAAKFHIEQIEQDIRRQEIMRRDSLDQKIRLVDQLNNKKAQNRNGNYSDHERQIESLTISAERNEHEIDRLKKVLEKKKELINGSNVRSNSNDSTANS